MRSTKICRKCGKIGHVEKYCLTTEGGCVFIGDLPPSYTEEEIRIHDDPNSSSSTSGKKRKKEKYKEKENCLGDSLSDNLEKIDSL